MLYTEISFIVILSLILVSSFIIFQLHSQSAFGIEENFLIFQTGIISTDTKDYAISNDFEFRIIQDGKIMRLSGITTTGEVYYLYQQIVDDKIIVKGKILVNGIFVPIKDKEKVVDSEIVATPKTKLIISAKLPDYTYAHYPATFSIKIFDVVNNPQAKFEDKYGTLENVIVNVTLTNQFGKYVTSFSGKTDSSGLYRESYVVRANIDLPGKYNVNVKANYGETTVDKFYTTFFRGNIQDYFKK